MPRDWFVGCALSLLLIAPGRVIASEPAGKDTALAEFLNRMNVQVRRTFDGSSKDEMKPASLSWISRDKQDGDDFFDVHLAAKMAGYSPLKSSPEKLILSPAFEWHRTSSESKPTSKASVRLLADYFPMGTPGQGPVSIVPLITANIQYGRDWENNQWKGSASLLAAPYGIGSLVPGYQTRFADRQGMLRYYVFGGIEYYDKTNGDDETELAAVVGRATAEVRLYAKADPEYGFLQIVGEYTVRGRVKHSDAFRSQIGLGVVQVNVYLDRKEHVSIGYQYQRGRDPGEDFNYSERHSVGLNFKF